MVRNDPYLLFRLFRQRERKLISYFLQRDDDDATAPIRGIRDTYDRDFLLYACTCHERIERIIEMLVRQHAYSLEATDSNGDDALTLANTYTDAKTQHMVAFLVAKQQSRREGQADS